MYLKIIFNFLLTRPFSWVIYLFFSVYVGRCGCARCYCKVVLLYFADCPLDIFSFSFFVYLCAAGSFSFFAI